MVASFGTTPRLELQKQINLLAEEDSSDLPT